MCISERSKSKVYKGVNSKKQEQVKIVNVRRKGK